MATMIAATAVLISQVYLVAYHSCAAKNYKCCGPGDTTMKHTFAVIALSALSRRIRGSDQTFSIGGIFDATQDSGPDRTILTAEKVRFDPHFGARRDARSLAVRAVAGNPIASILLEIAYLQIRKGNIMAEMSADHVRAAHPLLRLISILVALLGAILLIGGVYLAFVQRQAETTFTLFGNNFSSTDVGVAMAFIGVIMISLTFRWVLRTVRLLGGLPPDK